jgi:hypothetical protein
MLSGTGLVFSNTRDASVLEDALSSFSCLEHLDITANYFLKLLPAGLMRVASRLVTFKCENCPLILPPQRVLSSPERNPKVIQEILGGKLDLSLSDFSSSEAVEIASFLQFYPQLTYLNLSGNPKLGSAGIASIFSSLLGIIFIHRLPFCL